MFSINPSQKNDRDIRRNTAESIPKGIYPFQQDINITEGGEFLDDAIRTRDQPLYQSIVEERD